jgi:intracellular multiplication protein IcmD
MNRKMLKNMAIYALPLVFTAVANADTLANLATNVTAQFTAIGQLMIGVAYVAGIGFGISAIFKFKQHKDNPTQIPIGTPFALLAVSVLLVFLPGLYAPAGESVFGSTTSAGGFTGTGATTMPGGS